MEGFIQIKKIKKNIPEATINRLSIYHRSLELFITTKKYKNTETISSSEIARITGVNSNQIRKDLSCFGEFGKRGVGYPLYNLIDILRNILIANKKWDMILVGAGNIGQAFMRYKGFKSRGFIIKAVFDIDPNKVGKKIAGINIIDIAYLQDYVRINGIKIGIITVPAGIAQEIANKMIAGGIKSILNFAPIGISHPIDVKINHIDIGIELERLVYYLSSKSGIIL